MPPDISSEEAETRLKLFLIKKYGLSDSGTFPTDDPIYSMLLFQGAKNLSRISQSNQAHFVEATSSSRFRIDKNNINKYLSFPSRQPIKADAILINYDDAIYYIGEAKGTKDKTGKSAGYTYSCAHKVAHEIISDNPILIENSIGYTHSFLSQSLGYIDAFANRMIILNKLSRKLYFAWLICDDNPASKDKYSQLGQSLIDNLNNLFPFLINSLVFKEYLKENIFHYFIFETHFIKLHNICHYLANQFISRYFIGGETTMNNIPNSEIHDDDERELKSSLVVEACLSGLGLAAHAVSEMFRFRFETKRLEAESRRIIKALKTHEKVVDAQLKYELKKLDDRRKIIEKGLRLVSQELEQNHIERKSIIEIFSKLSDRLLDHNLTTEDKKEIQSAISTCSTLITDLGSKGSVNLSHIVDNTERTLRAIPQLNLLLEAPRN